MILYTYTSDEFHEMSQWNRDSAHAAGFGLWSQGLGDLHASCDSKDAGWIRLLRAKVDLVLGAIEKSWGKPFVFADADVRFYRGAYSDIRACLGDADIAFQCDWWGTGVKCQGLFIARGNDRVKRFFEDIRDCISLEHSDQDATNEILSKPYDLQYQLLPYRYWTQGASTGVRWKPGDPVNPPSDIMAHHANWTVGPEHKMALLRAVEEKVNAH